MRPARQETSVSRNKLLLIVGLIVLSTVLFVIGIAVERSQETAEGSGAHQEVSGAPESGKARESGEARERAEAREGEGGHQEPASKEQSETVEQQGEAILGINPEATGVVAAVIIGWLVLAVGLLLFGTRFPIVLILVALAAVAATVFDTLEVLGQLARNNGGVAALAATVALLHAAIAILSIWFLWEHRTYQRLISRS